MEISLQNTHVTNAVGKCNFFIFLPIFMVISLHEKMQPNSSEFTMCFPPSSLHKCTEHPLRVRPGTWNPSLMEIRVGQEQPSHQALSM